MFKSVILLTLIALSLSTLEVYGPSCAKQLFKKTIPYTLSNFGEIPYGQTIIGQVKLPKDPLLCSIKNQQMNFNQDSSIKTILLVKRGECKFTQKVINAQNLGADLIIIYDHFPGSTPSVIMKNDGHGHLADIPSLFISMSDGQLMTTGSKDCPDHPIMRVHFDMDQAEVSDVTFWVDASSRQTYILARDFHKNDYYDVLKDKINLSIRFRVQNTCQDWICSKDDCLGILMQKYCRNVEKSDNPDIPDPKGSDLIYEQLRQHFLWEEIKKGQERQLWWRYMAKFDHNICVEQKDIADCSYSSMRELGLSEATINNVKTNSEAEITKIIDKKPNILRQSYQESREAGIYFFPEVTINDRNFYGLFKAPQVFEAICDSLESPPGQCISFIKQNHEEYNIDETGGVWTTIMIILLVMTLGFLIALFVYTKIIKREVNQQLSVEVNKMVQKYVNLSGKKGNSTSSSYNKFDS